MKTGIYVCVCLCLIKCFIFFFKKKILLPLLIPFFFNLQDVGATGGEVWDEKMVTGCKGFDWKGGKAV